MRVTQSQPSSPVITTDDLAGHLSLDSAIKSQDATLLANMVAAATSYAEKRMGRSLLQRTVTATFYANLERPDDLYLPRGPIISITSVTPTGGTALDPSTYVLEYVGNATARLKVNGGTTYAKDLIVVYEAGHAADQVPADLVHAVRMHAGYLYENRSGDAPPPEHLNAFYDLNSWISAIG